MFFGNTRICPIVSCCILVTVNRIQIVILLISFKFQMLPGQYLSTTLFTGDMFWSTQKQNIGFLWVKRAIPPSLGLCSNLRQLFSKLISKCNYVTCLFLSSCTFITVITARKRSLGQGYIFTSVCHPVHRGACLRHTCPPGTHNPRHPLLLCLSHFFS